MTQNVNLENEVISLRQENIGYQHRVVALQQLLSTVREDNMKLADRNWELQKRLVEQATWPKA